MLIIKNKKLLLKLSILLAIILVIYFFTIKTKKPSDNNVDKTPEVSVGIAKVKRGDMETWIFSEGTARSVRREYLTFENPGKVDYIKIKANGEELKEGDPVKKGELLAHQDQRAYKADLDVAKASVNEALTEISVAKSEIEQRKADLELAEKTFERYRVLLEQKSASIQEYDEAKTNANKAQAAVVSAESRLFASKAKLRKAKASIEQAKVALEQTELRSPIDGVLSYLNIDKGIYFTPNFVNTKDETSALQTIPMVIIDPDKYEITVEVPFYERHRLKVQRQAIIFPGNELPNQQNGIYVRNDNNVINGNIFSVNPAISPGGRTIKVKIRTTTSSDKIQDGMFITTWISAEKKEKVLIIPYDCLVYKNNTTFVYRIDKERNVAELKEIKTGLQGFNGIEVLEGLQENDTIVTMGRFQISDGTKVKIVESAKEDSN